MRVRASVGGIVVSIVAFQAIDPGSANASFVFLDAQDIYTSCKK